MKTANKKNIIIITFCLFISISLFAQNSYIQVISKSGISIFLDGNFQGKTSSDIGGLIIENVDLGRHILKVVKKGFTPQEEDINIKQGEVYSYKVKPFIPQIKISQKGNEGSQSLELKTGNLKIQSIPVSILISIPKLNIKSAKSEDEWLAEEIPIGSLYITFNLKGKRLNKTVEINENELTHLFVNMIKLEIKDHSISDSNLNYNETEDLEEVLEETVEIEEKKSIERKNYELIEVVESEEVLDDVPFAIIEDVPVYPGCKGRNSQKKKCMVDKIQEFINDNFNYRIANDIGLIPGKKRVYAQFKIDKTGKITDIRAKGPHERLEKEAVKVISSLPNMTPGKQRGRAVGVKYTLPITLVVE